MPVTKFDATGLFWALLAVLLAATVYTAARSVRSVRCAPGSFPWRWIAVAVLVLVGLAAVLTRGLHLAPITLLATLPVGVALGVIAAWIGARSGEHWWWSDRFAVALGVLAVAVFSACLTRFGVAWLGFDDLDMMYAVVLGAPLGTLAVAALCQTMPAGDARTNATRAALVLGVTLAAVLAMTTAYSAAAAATLLPDESPLTDRASLIHAMTRRPVMVLSMAALIVVAWGHAGHAVKRPENDRISAWLFVVLTGLSIAACGVELIRGPMLDAMEKVGIMPLFPLPGWLLGGIGAIVVVVWLGRRGRYDPVAAAAVLLIVLLGPMVAVFMAGAPSSPLLPLAGTAAAVAATFVAAVMVAGSRLASWSRFDTAILTGAGGLALLLTLALSTRHAMNQSAIETYAAFREKAPNVSDEQLVKQTRLADHAIYQGNGRFAWVVRSTFKYFDGLLPEHTPDADARLKTLERNSIFAAWPINEKGDPDGRIMFYNADRVALYLPVHGGDLGESKPIVITHPARRAPPVTVQSWAQINASNWRVWAALALGIASASMLLASRAAHMGVALVIGIGATIVSAWAFGVAGLGVFLGVRLLILTAAVVVGRIDPVRLAVLTLVPMAVASACAGPLLALAS